MLPINGTLLYSPVVLTVTISVKFDTKKAIIIVKPKLKKTDLVLRWQRKEIILELIVISSSFKYPKLI